jgi:hypothetical protein
LFGILGVLAAIIFCRRRDQSCDLCSICCFCCMKPSNKVGDESKLIDNENHCFQQQSLNLIMGNASHATGVIVETPANGHVSSVSGHPCSRGNPVSTFSSTIASNLRDHSNENLLFDKRSINNNHALGHHPHPSHSSSRNNMTNSWDNNSQEVISTSYLWHFSQKRGV